MIFSFPAILTARLRAGFNRGSTERRRQRWRSIAITSAPWRHVDEERLSRRPRKNPRQHALRGL